PGLRISTSVSRSPRCSEWSTTPPSGTSPADAFARLRSPTATSACCSPDLRARDVKLDSLRGHSSVGRAPALQAGGRRFDPGWLHPTNTLEMRNFCAHPQNGCGDEGI